MSQSEDGHKNPEEKKQPDAGSAADGTKDSSGPKSKSYAEILKGFEEIEKIFKRDQDKN